jgi:hypothetical protein
MAPSSTQPLIEVSTRNLPWGKGWPSRKADNLAGVCEPTVPRHLVTLWASTVCYRDSFIILPIGTPGKLLLKKPIALNSTPLFV